MATKGRIYVFDNGMDYSDHSIAFIRSDWPEDVTIAAMSAQSRWEHWSLVLVADVIEWRDESAAESIKEYVGTAIGTSEMMDAIGPDRAREVVAYLRGKPKLWPGERTAVETAEKWLAALDARAEAPDGR